MDAYEATKMVFSRIQTLDPDNAATVMGVLLIQDPGEQEMIRLAFGPDSLLRAVITESLHKHHHQQGGAAAAAPHPSSPPPPHFFQQPADFDDDQLFCGSLHNAVVGPRGGPMMTAAPDHAGGRCHYFSRGYCKNGPGCRFFHHGCAPPPPPPTQHANHNTSSDAGDDDYYHTQLPHHQSNTLLGSPRLSPTPPSFAAPSPKSLTTLNLLRLQQLHHHRRLLQRAEDDEAAATATLRLLNIRAGHGHALYSSPAPDMLSPASRQIYLTFPADSTFTEEDVSSYFSIYGPVQDVRIPYQQKRMFGFVSFVYPETVRMVLAKGNPHFVCDSRVLVKPYKEKPKLRDTNSLSTTDSDTYCTRRKPLMSERSDFSGAGIDDTPYHQLGFHPLEAVAGSRMMLSGNQEAAAAILLRRKMEGDQAALHHAIELQRKRFAGLQMLDLNNNHHRDVSPPVQPVSSLSPNPIFAPPAGTTAHSAVTTAAAPPIHLPCSETDQGNRFHPASDTFASEPPLTVATADSEVDASDAVKETLETQDTDQDTKFIGTPAMSEAAPHTHVGAGSGLLETHKHATDDSYLIQGSEHNLPERSLPSLTKSSLIHNFPSPISEELETAMFPAPWFLSNPVTRCQAGHGAVGM